MVTVVDKAGRVVIPAAARRRLHLTPGAELEVVVDDLSIRLVRKVQGARLTRAGGRLVARPGGKKGASLPIDFAALVDEERNRWPW
jgi:AbrB family looped-hinge helix DNA binding protein